jgi:hypothetical protein
VSTLLSCLRPEGGCGYFPLAQVHRFGIVSGQKSADLVEYRPDTRQKGDGVCLIVQLRPHPRHPLHLLGHPATCSTDLYIAQPSLATHLMYTHSCSFFYTVRISLHFSSVRYLLNVVPSSWILSTMKMEATSSFKTSVPTRSHNATAQKTVFFAQIQLYNSTNFDLTRIL